MKESPLLFVLMLLMGFDVEENLTTKKIWHLILYEERERTRVEERQTEQLFISTMPGVSRTMFIKDV